jgi:aspartyl-tRNA(Asn)/glutamyl-tRNA(Gln) amidotransferase subunit A
MSEKWLWMTAADLGRGIEAGDIDPLALARTYLGAAGIHEFGKRIYARLTPDLAIAAATAASERAKRGQRLGPLDGVPVSWKDLYDTAGVATEAGTTLLSGRMPVRNARVFDTAAANGLVCLGKTHLTELAFSGLGYNPVTASPPNVNDVGAVAGGSSSGAATSVAFGLAASSVGSDTGGSIRIPAAWNDLAGFKPTHGRLPLDGVVPLAERFDTVGPLARSVEDCALMVAALEGSRAPDLRGASLDGVRLGVLETVALDDLSEQSALGFNTAMSAFGGAGAKIERVAVPEVGEAMTLAAVLYTTEAYAIWGERIEAAPDQMFAPIRDRFRLGGGYSGVEYVRAWRRLSDLRRAYAEATAGYDAIILPTAPNTPPALERLAKDPDYFAHENLLTLRNTRIGNLMGLPALTVPTGAPSAGVMLMAGAGQDDRLLRLGSAAEAALRKV